MEVIGNFLQPWIPNVFVQALIIIIAFFIISKLCVWISEKIFLRIARKTTTQVDDLIIEQTNKPVSLVLLLIGLRLAIEVLGLTEFWESILVPIIWSFTIIVLAYIIIRVVDILIDNWGREWAKKTKSSVDDQLLIVLHRFTKVIFAIIAFLWILDIWGIKVGPMLASLGIAGIAIAFALQSTLGNIFGGISLIIDKTIKVGDVIEVDATTRGTVLDVGLRSTRIRTFDNEVVIVPNGKLADNKIQNYVPPDPSVRVVIPFGVAYGSDVDKVKKIVLKEIIEIEGVMKDPEPFVRFLAMADSSLNFKAYFWVDDYTKRFPAIDQANILIYKALNKNKISIPFPQMDVHLKKK